MRAIVACPRLNTQVFGTIVGPIAVDVMNNLSIPQWPTDFLFGYDTVFAATLICAPYF